MPANRLWTERPKLPVLYTLHGHDDGCAIQHSLIGRQGCCPPASEGIGGTRRALQLEQPDKIAELIVAFIGSPGWSWPELCGSAAVDAQILDVGQSPNDQFLLCVRW